MSAPTRYALVTFDVYTALFDIETSLAPHVAAALDGDTDSLAFVRAWRRRQMEGVLISNSLQQARLSFERITRDALDDTLARVGRDVPERTREDLVRAWRTLEPWPDACDALVAVKARGYAMGLLSNGDEDMLQALLLKLPVVFDHMFSSEEAGCYKPHPAVYALPLHRLGLGADQVLHVAGSVTDVIGTKAAGLACLWSNRRHEPLLDRRYAPDHEVADLASVPALLE
jgi:2-haloacid dehalogenase